MRRSKDYSPVTWDKYFDSMHDIYVNGDVSFEEMFLPHDKINKLCTLWHFKKNYCICSDKYVPRRYNKVVIAPCMYDIQLYLCMEIFTDSASSCSITTPQTFRVYQNGDEGPVCLFLHGGGYSALSWAVMSVSEQRFVNLEEKMICSNIQVDDSLKHI